MRGQPNVWEHVPTGPQNQRTFQTVCTMLRAPSLSSCTLNACNSHPAVHCASFRPAPWRGGTFPGTRLIHESRLCASSPCCIAQICWPLLTEWPSRVHQSQWAPHAWEPLGPRRANNLRAGRQHLPCQQWESPPRTACTQPSKQAARAAGSWGARTWSARTRGSC